MYMFEDTLFERLLEALRVRDRVVATSHLLYEFQSDCERVALAYQLLVEENLMPCMQLNATNETRKSQTLASNLRSEGNEAFKRKQDMDALNFYNRSLASAPVNSKEFALAIANRSAVNFSLGFFKACLRDIELAAQHGYPGELRIKLLERRVKCLTQLGMVSQCEGALKDVVDEWNKLPQGKKILQEAHLHSLARDIVILHDKKSNKKIEKLRSVSEFGCFDKPSLSYDLNAEIECASSCIALRYSEEKGRHMVATRRIKPGDVLIVEQPYASILLQDSAMTHCYNCLTHCLSPIPCLHCTEVMFCDEKCRTEAWEQFHSIDCPLLPLLFENLSKLGHLALRILILTSKKGSDLKRLYDEDAKFEKLGVPKDTRTLGFNEEGRYISTDYWPMYFLVGHTKRRSTADLFRRSVTAACLLHCLEGRTNFFPADVDDHTYFFCGGLLLRHMQSLPCNAHEVSEMIVSTKKFNSREIGAAGYATLSLLNHSCDPNVVRHSYKDWAVLRAIRTINEGEDILDNYGYHHALHSCDVRHSKLSKQYFFNCTCEACHKHWPLYNMQPVTDPLFKCRECGVALVKENYPLVKVPCVCGAVTDLEELDSNLKKSSNYFIDTLTSVVDGQQFPEVPKTLLQHLDLLENSIQRPWREFSECQETIKQCLSLQANHTLFCKKSNDQ